jgi:hypothetical protein
MVEYGAWIRSAYTPDYFPPDPRVDHTSKILIFMPEDLFSVVYMQYVMDCEKKFKYARLGLSRYGFHSRLDKALRFYDRYRDTDFS